MVLEPWSPLTIVQLASSFRQSVPNRVKFHVLLQLIQPRDGSFQQDDSVLRNVKSGFLERSLNVLFFLSWAEAYFGTAFGVLCTAKPGSSRLL